MRLSRARDIKRVFRSGLTISNAYVTIRARRRKARWPRLALAVARKHAGSAVKRNAVKRITRESFRRHTKLLSGLDIVVISRPAICGIGKKLLRQTLDAEWARLEDKGRGYPEKP